MHQTFVSRMIHEIENNTGVRLRRIYITQQAIQFAVNASVGEVQNCPTLEHEAQTSRTSRNLNSGQFTRQLHSVFDRKRAAAEQDHMDRLASIIDDSDSSHLKNYNGEHKRGMQHVGRLRNSSTIGLEPMQANSCVQQEITGAMRISSALADRVVKKEICQSFNSNA